MAAMGCIRVSLEEGGLIKEDLVMDLIWRTRPSKAELRSYQAPERTTILKVDSFGTSQLR
jgi:hypothetical protein